MPSLKNIERVKELKEKLKGAKSVVFMDYRGSSAHESSNLRKVVSQNEGTEYLIAKNRLFKIALDESDMLNDKIAESLKGPTSFLISYEDPLAAARLTKNFRDSSKLFKVKGGILDLKFLSGDDVVEISNLPSREVLISMLMAQLKAPIQKLHYALSYNLKNLAQVLKSISEKK